MADENRIETIFSCIFYFPFLFKIISPYMDKWNKIEKKVSKIILLFLEKTQMFPSFSSHFFSSFNPSSSFLSQFIGRTEEKRRRRKIFMTISIKFWVYSKINANRICMYTYISFRNLFAFHFVHVIYTYSYSYLIHWPSSWSSLSILPYINIQSTFPYQLPK